SSRSARTTPSSRPPSSSAPYCNANATTPPADQVGRQKTFDGLLARLDSEACLKGTDVPLLTFHPHNGPTGAVIASSDLPRFEGLGGQRVPHLVWDVWPIPA